MSTMMATQPQDKLLQTLAQHHHAVLAAHLSETWQGEYITISDVPPDVSTFVRWWSDKVDPRGRGLSPLLLIGWLLLMPVDLVCLLFRPLALAVVWPLWRLERIVARLRGIRFFCPICHHDTADPYVYCPQCGRVQGLIRPTIGTVFSWSCAECGRTSWPILGNYLRRRPKHLVCRNTLDTFGCYRPLPFDNHWRPTLPRHVVVASGGMRAKHAFLAHFAHHAVSHRPASSAAPWDFHRFELEYLKGHVAYSYSRDTAACEQPGAAYTLARSLILQRADDRWLVIHNLALPWLQSEKELLTRGPNWKSVHSLVFVVDLDELEADGRPVAISHVESFERILRAAQYKIPVEPNAPFPLKIAIAVPIPDTKGGKVYATAARELSSADAEEVVRKAVPSLYALVRSCTSKKNVRFFGGNLPDGLLPERTHWIKKLIDWIA
jgi:hypothetical protein